jgi:TDG/mug DNA glycosylase family protein
VPTDPDALPDVLPDVLQPGLDVVFVGTAAGDVSARRGVYYAHRGNKFWDILARTGLIPAAFRREDFRDAVLHGIGFTDLCKTRSGMDHHHRRDDFDVARFERRIRAAAPKLVAFTSKRGAAIWLGCGTGAVALGPRAASADGFPPMFVLPSPSGAAGSHWDEAPWFDLARRVRDERAGRAA